VAQAIPVYVMSCFLLPIPLCEDIERAVCNFWWGGNEQTRKIHWVSKQKLFQHKRDGGMGFKILRDFNLAMLAKQIWRMQVSPNSLLARKFKAKYFPHTEIIKATIGSSPSYAWRSMYQAIWIINKGSCWKIGNGHHVNISTDNWLPLQNGLKPISPNLGSHEPRMVKDLIKDNPFE